MKKQKTKYRKKSSFACHDAEWSLPGKMKIFAYCTIAENQTIMCLLEEYGSVSNVLSANLLLSKEERYILEFLKEHKVEHPNTLINQFKWEK